MNQNITENLNNLKSNILKVCKKVNRNPSSINIVAVSKEQPFKKIETCSLSIKQFCPDIIFVVGLSQIIPESIISIPKISRCHDC